MTMENEIEQLKAIVAQLRDEINGLKDKGGASSNQDAGRISEDQLAAMVAQQHNLADKVEKLEASMQSEKDIVAEVTEKMRGETLLSPARSATNYNPGFKGGPPPGMTPEQVQEFKKQGLQINTLLSKAKELEARLVEADNAIKRGQDKAREMETEEEEHVKELYAYFDHVNNTLSEKIANQRVETEKLAGDTPQPINYDPFNYGEAYEGDIVDFQARKRILEIRLLLTGLTSTMTRMMEAIRVSPPVDLGYRVVRLDELVQGAKFKDAVDKGEISQGQALHVTQGENVEPPEPVFPRKEIFQESQEQDSVWTIINSVMQTMYRLETEVGELQKVSYTGGTMKNAKDFEELAATIQLVKETKLDANAVRKMLDDEQHKQHAANARPQAILPKHTTGSKKEAPGSPKVEQMIENLQKSVLQLIKKIKSLEAANKPPPPVAIEKSWVPRCLTCDRSFQRPAYKEPLVPLPRPEPFSPYAYPRDKETGKRLPRLRSLRHRAYKFQVENLFIDMYQIPRPVGGGYSANWPRSIKVITAERGENVIQGTDGRLYKGGR